MFQVRATPVACQFGEDLNRFLTTRPAICRTVGLAVSVSPALPLFSALMK